MRPNELLDQLKSMPPGEQAAFERLLRQWQSEFAGRTIPDGQPPPPDFLNRLQRIYGTKITSDSTSLISELRGDR